MAINISSISSKSAIRPKQCSRSGAPAAPHRARRRCAAAAAASLGGGAGSGAAAVVTAEAPAAGKQQQRQPSLLQPLLPEITPPAQRLRELRQRFCRDYLLAGGLVFLSAGDLLPRNGDVLHHFRAQSDFLYLAGLDEPGYACLLDADAGGHLTLLAPRAPEEAAIWTGPQPPLDAVAAEVGADAAAYADELPALLRARRQRAAAGATGAPLLHVLEGSLPALAAAGVDAGKEGGDNAAGVRVTADFLAGALARSRARKTLAEVACLLEANRVSAAAHEALWARCCGGLSIGSTTTTTLSSSSHHRHPAVFEYQLEAAFTAACADAGLRRLGYPAIVGAGANAGILHYERNAARVSPRDLVLVDAGAEFAGYTADITRTFPAGGAFEARARAVYELTLAAQAAALAGVRAGADWARDVEAPARRVVLEGLRDMGLVRGDVDDMLAARVDRVFCPHGLGHHLGLDVHDVSEHGPVPNKAPLEPGFVVTVEPGIYFMPLLLARAEADAAGTGRFLVREEIAAYEGLGGVRIEDNVALLPAEAVAAAGGGNGSNGGNGGSKAAAAAAAVLNLTTATGRAPKAPADVEAAMAAMVAASAPRRR